MTGAYHFDLEEEPIAEDDRQASIDRARRYLDNQLAGAGSITELVDGIGGFSGCLKRKLDVSRGAVEDFAQDCLAPLPALLAAVFGYTLSRFTGDTRALFNVIGVDTGASLAVDDAAGGQEGMLPVVIDCSDCKAAVFVQQAASAVGDALSHGPLSPKLLACEYGISPQAAFRYQRFDACGKTPDEASAADETSAGKSLDFRIVDDGESLRIHASHSARHPQATIERIAQVYGAILQGLLEKDRLSDIEYCSAGDRAYQDSINKTEAVLEHADVLDAFAESLARFPENALVTHGDASCTYAQGAAIAMRIADALADAGVKAGGHVAILVPRGEWYLLAALGVLAAGCAYVPLDDAYPDERLAFMLSDTCATAMLATDETAGRAQTLLTSIGLGSPVIDVSALQKAAPSIRPFSYRTPNPDDTACLLYTSGTTGKPKGALITRRALNNYTSWFADYAQVGPDDSMCLYRSFGFDSGNTGMYVALRHGGSLAVVPWDCRLDAAKFRDYAAQHNLTICGGLPVGFIKAYLEKYRFDTLKIIITGGESFGSAPGIPDILHDGYGPTESLDAVCVVRMNDRIHHSSVGSFLPNIKGYVLDAELRRVPVGAVGQLYVSGHQLAKGYLNQPELTARSFMSNPFDGDRPGYARMYATGDMVRILPDGTIGFEGRRDSQVKVRGNRVELTEVEACIRELVCVRDATVQAIEAGGAKEIAAYVVLQAPDADEAGSPLPAKPQDAKDEELFEIISSHVAASKPAYMVPAFVMALDAIPLTVNGKIDRRALPKPDLSALRAAYVPPENDLQQCIVDAFEEVLGVSPIGIDDDFIRLGGDSLAAIRLLVRMGDIGVTAACVLERKTPRLIAADAQDPALASLDLNIYQNAERVPLSEPQLNVYLDIEANPKAGAYLLPRTLRVDGKYTPADVTRAIASFLEAHPVLASRIVSDNQGVCLEAADGFEIDMMDDPDGDTIREYASRPLDMGSSLCRFAIANRGGRLFIIAVFHHIAFDGMSSIAFERDMTDALEGKALAKDTAYRRASALSAQIKATPAYEEAKSFFDSQLCEVDGIPELVEDVDGRTGSLSCALQVSRDEIARFAKRHAISASALLSACFGFVLSRFTGGQRALFHVADNGRDRLGDANGSIGMFVSTLPVVIDCDMQGTDEFLEHAASNLYRTLSYGFYPYRLIAAKYRISPSIIFQYFPFAHAAAGEENGSEDIEHYLDDRDDLITDLSVVVTDAEQGLELTITRSSKYSQATARRMAFAYEAVLRGMLEKDRLPDIAYASAEDLEALAALNKTEAALEHADVMDAFAAAVARWPENTLITCNGAECTYAQGAAIVSAVAGALTDAGVGSGANVAVLVPRSEWYLLCALGALAAGCAYAPMDGAHPDERLTFMLADTSAAAVLATVETAARARGLLAAMGSDAPVICVDGLRDAASRPLPRRAPDPDAVACILYTSGTTGHPKGSLITRRALASFSGWFASEYALDESDVYGMYVSFSFDAHAMALYPPLFAGASIDVIPEELRLDAHALVRHISDRGITRTCITTKVAKIVAPLIGGPCLRTLHTGGEAFGSYEGNHSFDFIDGYGPTENLIYASCCPMNKRLHSSSIGRLVWNTKGYVLDAGLRRVPVGAVGQLYLSGWQLARGYLNRPEETAAAFVPNPFDGDELGYEHMYATGDMVRILPDGTIGFVGRRDLQVKIRGNRVEPAEVEACIREMGGVRDVTVQAIADGGAKELVAYVVPARPMDAAELFRFVTAHVATSKPAYMVPAFVVAMDAIPLNIHGKVNRPALPAPDVSTLRAKYACAENDIQQRIATAFEQVLGISPIGIDDDFIRLGGDSIKAIRILALLREAGIMCSGKDVLEGRTPRIIAETAESSAQENDYGHTQGELGLLPIQSYFFDEIGRDDFAQTITLASKKPLDGEMLAQSLRQLTDTHDMLRAIYTRDSQGNMSQAIRPQGSDVAILECLEAKHADAQKVIADKIREGIGSLDICQGRLIYALLVQTDEKSYLAFAIHHLIVDGVSWAILIEDLAKIYTSLRSGEHIEIPCPFPYRDWVERVREYAKTIGKDAVLRYKSIADKLDDEAIGGEAASYSLSVPASFIADNIYQLSEHEYLMCAIARAYKKAYGANPIFNEESYGRDESIAMVNRTVGWFTTQYLLNPAIGGEDDEIGLAKDLYSIMQSRASVAHLGIDYGCLTYLTGDITAKHAPITFNFQSDEFSFENELFGVPDFITGGVADAQLRMQDTGDRTYGMSINISRFGHTYAIEGWLAKGSYLEKGFACFIDAFKEELGRINDVLIARGQTGRIVSPLSFCQLGVYLDEIMHSRGTAYSCFGCFAPQRPITVDRARQAVDTLISLHPVLSSRIVDTDAFPVLVCDAPPAIEVVYADAADADSLRSRLVKPFDLHESLARFWIVLTGEQVAIAYDMHHTICDATSRSLVSRELDDILAQNRRRELDLGFLRTALDEMGKGAGDRKRSACAFFEEMFADIDDTLTLIDDAEGCSGSVFLPIRAIRQDVEDFCARHATTPGSLLNIVFAYTLSRFTGSDACRYNFIHHGRRAAYNQETLGMYAETIPVALDCTDTTIDSFVKASTQRLLEAMGSSACPFSELASRYGLTNDIVFECNGVLNDVSHVTGEGLVEHVNMPGEVEFFAEFACVTNDFGDGFLITIEHRESYSQDMAKRFALAYEAVLRGMIAKDRLSDIAFASAEDIAMQDALNRTETDLEHADVMDAFAATLARCPENVLATYEDASYTYKQGAAIAMAITDALADIGIGPRANAAIEGTAEGANEQPQANVAILVPRSAWYLLAALGVLTAGCAYVPMDDTYPDERLAFMLSDTSAAAVLVTSATTERARALLASAGSDAAIIDVAALGDATIEANAHKDAAVLEPGVLGHVGDGSGVQPFGTLPFSYRKPDPDGTACILYTSGTTGKPKGSLITRRAVASFAQWMADATSMAEDDVYGMYCSIAFDAHAMALYPPLCVGASIDVVPEAARLDLAALNDHFVAHGCTHTYITSQVGKLFAEAGFDTTIRLICFGGMKLGHLEAPDSVGPFESYGPTENLAISTSIFANDRCCDSSVGRFVWNTKGYVLDTEMRRVPTGAAGQLYLSGYQLARGYLNRPKETAAAFIPNPFDGNEPGYERMYATGDMVRILPDGTIGFIGRRDSQVKIRGNRVETGEVEACIRQMDCVVDVTVQAVDANGSTELAAYVVADAAQADLYRVVTSHVASLKPGYMVPAFVIALEAIPLTVNGKVDRRALPEPSWVSADEKASMPSTYMQAKMLSCVCDILNIDPDDRAIGVESDLRRYGLDSLSAIKLAMLIKDRCCVQFSAADILGNPSIDRFAKSFAAGSYRPIHVYREIPGAKQLFFVHPGDKGAESYAEYAKAFKDACSFSCIENYNRYHLDGIRKGYRELAKLYLGFLLERQPEGPYYLGGWCFGGVVAYEMACMLQSQGQKVEGLYLLNSGYAKNSWNDEEWAQDARIASDLLLTQERFAEFEGLLSEQVRSDYRQFLYETILMGQGYAPSTYKGDVMLFKTTVQSEDSQLLDALLPDDLLAKSEDSFDKSANGFEDFAPCIRVVRIPFAHNELPQEAPAKMIASAIIADMNRAKL